VWYKNLTRLLVKIGVDVNKKNYCWITSLTWRQEEFGILREVGITRSKSCNNLLDRIRYYLCVSSFSPLLWKGILPPNIEVLSLLLLHGRVSIKDFLARRILLTIFQQVVPFLIQKKKQLSIFSLHCYETWKVWNHFILWIGLQWCMLKFLESLMMQWKIQIEASFNKKKPIQRMMSMQC